MLLELFVSIANADLITKPKSYGTFHLSFTIVGFALCLVFAYLLRKIGNKASDRLIFGCGAFLAVTEVYKQLFYYFCMGGDVGYEWWIFPFQLCSVPMYFCLIVPFIKNERIKSAMYTFMGTYNLLGGFIAFFEPSGLLHNHLTLTLHAFVWHMLLVFIGFYLIASGRSGYKMRNFLDSALIFVGLCVIAFIINLSLRGVSGGSVNMFYVGPTISPLIVFKSIATVCGWYVNTPLYMIALTIGAFIFFIPHYYVRKHLNKKL